MNERKQQHFKLTLLCAGALALGLTILGSSGVSADDQEWPTYGGTHWNERHVKLEKINKHTVKNLVPRRVLQLGKTQYSMSASPLVVGGVLYVSGSDGLVQAFDLRTSMRMWSFQHKIDLGTTISPVYGTAGPACCSNTNRGLAYAQDTLFMGGDRCVRHCDRRQDRKAEVARSGRPRG